MPQFREKLWPSPWVFIATALVIPACILVFVPISLLAGIITAIVFYGAIVLILVLTSPTVEVKDGILSAGHARISAEMLGEALPFEGEDARAERSTRMDMRAWLLIRGWIAPVVRIPITDANDPAPYWIVSTRYPQKLAAAINGSRRPL
ncbi:DUF3093 domain-containing protein [Glaciibacter psychrotolerans]|uniref:DUF3093 domain-containing protein n=1 Tax=Glaciibacter psychrotolerans TaxID=670054 RepID=A0A7Z0EDQ1_9MICO|nr:DUF3093 domain-containing protein [Leifsonia psychrotolerans]NYJ19007.1 hypothetical protein [Leifsonia psychrotolerans]